MDMMVFMEGMVYVREIEWKNVTSFVWRKNYVYHIHGLRDGKIGR